jgi:hypothetical protein
MFHFRGFVHDFSSPWNSFPPFSSYGSQLRYYFFLEALAKNPVLVICCLPCSYIIHCKNQSIAYFPFSVGYKFYMGRDWFFTVSQYLICMLLNDC